MDTSVRGMAFDPLAEILHDFLEIPSDDTEQKLHYHAPTRAYLRDTKAMAATPADAKETPDNFIFVLDMPGLKKDQVKVQVEEGDLLVVSGERKREKERDQGVKYLKMERRLGKYLKKFQLSENAEIDKISAVYEDGVLTVTAPKKPRPEPKKAKTIEVQVA